MATAQELFSLTNSTEEHIVVGADRYITVPEPLKRIAVQFDHDVETVTFDCPRYWDDLDMSTMTVYINYKLPNGDLDAYPAKNINADGDIMHFDWTISNKVTQYKGNLTFLVCVKKTGADGAEVNHWNSELCTDMYISEGMECEEQTQLEYSDLITQLLERMTVVEQINVQADEMREMHDEVLDETTGIRQTSANTIKGTASGEIIQIDDISPVKHNVKTKISGKNLWNNLAFRVAEPTNSMYISNVTANAITLTSVEGYVGNGHHPTDITLRQVCPQMRVGKTYILQAQTVAYVRSIYLKEIQTYWNFNSPLIITEAMLDSTVGIYGLNTMHEQGVGDCVISNIQIEEGDTTTDYEPYIDPATVTVTGCGKNLIPFNNKTYYNGRYKAGQTYEKSGVNFTINDDGSIYAQGTATETFSFQLFSGGTFSTGVHTVTLSGSPGDSSTSTYMLRLRNAEGGSGIHDDCGDGVTVHNTNITKSSIAIIVISGAIIDTTFYPMLELGDTVSDFVPPCDRYSATANENGVVKLASISPTMTLFTDTPGVTLDCEYNKDIQKVAGINVNRYEFSIQQLNDIYTKYQVVNKPISVGVCELNSLPALRIYYRLYAATISGGVVTKLFDIPIEYNPNPNTALYELTVLNASEFKCGYLKLSDKWIDFNRLIMQQIYNGSFHQFFESYASISNKEVYGIAYTQTISFNTTNERDAMKTQIETIISAATNVAWEYNPINKITTTPRYLGE